MSATDLHAVACTLRFAAQTVEMTELPGETPAEPQPAPAADEPGVRQSPATSAKPATPSDELQVIAALHRIGADLGEPVEVRREGPEVVVNAAAVGPRRQEEVKTALAGLRAVRLEFEPRAKNDLESTGLSRRSRRRRAASATTRPCPQHAAAAFALSLLRRECRARTGRADAP